MPSPPTALDVVADLKEAIASFERATDIENQDKFLNEVKFLTSYLEDLLKEKDRDE